MRKHDFKKLALLGVSSGLLIAHPVAAVSNTSTKTTDSKSNSKSYDPNDGNMNYHLMTEEELKLQLNGEGISIYDSLDEEGKRLARKVASMACAGTNDCKRLGACKTDKNECAGKNACKGKGTCAHSDKNQAVKLVRDHMALKRAGMLPSLNNPGKMQPAN